MPTYTIRWAAFGPRPLDAAQFLAALSSNPIHMEGVSLGDAVVTPAVPITLRTTTAADGSVDVTVAGGPYDGWSVLGPNDQTTRAVRYVTGFAVNLTVPRTLTDAERRTLRQALNRSLAALEPYGYFGHTVGVTVRPVGEADPAYAMLAAPRAGGGLWPLLLIGVGVGMFYYSQRRPA